jgi:hypothetical protein
MGHWEEGVASCVGLEVEYGVEYDSLSGRLVFIVCNKIWRFLFVVGFVWVGRLLYSNNGVQSCRSALITHSVRAEDLDALASAMEQSKRRALLACPSSSSSPTRRRLALIPLLNGGPKLDEMGAVGFIVHLVCL